MLSLTVELPQHEVFAGVSTRSSRAILERYTGDESDPELAPEWLYGWRSFGRVVCGAVKEAVGPRGRVANHLFGLALNREQLLQVRNKNVYTCPCLTCNLSLACLSTSLNGL